MNLNWNNIDDIAVELFEQDTSYNPLQIKFTDLIEKVLALPGFNGERNKCNEKILEAIQMAWLEEFNDNE